MAQIIVQNLTSSSLVLPGLRYTSALGPNTSATFEVPDADEFLSHATMQKLIDEKIVSIKFTSSDALLRPLQVWTTSTLPDAESATSGTVVWDSTDRTFKVSNGTSWSPMIDGTSVLADVHTSDIPAYRLVGLNATMKLVASPEADERWAGVTTEVATAGGTARVQTGGTALVMPAGNLAANGDIVAMPGGFAAPYQATPIALTTALAGADANDDIDQTILPSTVRVTCTGDETGNTVVVYGRVGAVLTKETITLGTAGVYNGTAVFAAIYGLNVTALSVGTIDITAAAAGLLIPQIAGAVAARFYGALTPATTATVGHNAAISAGGANTAFVMLRGTDYAGVEQYEIVEMDGTTVKYGTLAFRTLTHVLIGADGIVWNAGVTSEYTSLVDADPRRTVRAVANAAATIAGATVSCTLLPQNQGLQAGRFPAPYYAAIVDIAGGGATEDVTIPGILVTDVIQASLMTRTAAAIIHMANYQAADTCRITFSGAPGASTVSITIWRP